ncbi:type II toxin-antitoxin system RelE/ParE family toxin [Nitrosomonas eutropha]|uniref:type II toxin-antitoxin system RelE/ParE family toxin n=1 Tax=Nitrosomonas eutropha TaxID=916 RepID=UPI0003252DE2|nr:type II toxin-antitoxin system RelE/ParE family toxin [Nitrosomonas eutropha]
MKREARHVTLSIKQRAKDTCLIRNFKHKGLETFFKTGSTKGIQAEHAAKLGRILRALNVAQAPAELDFPGFRLHPLKGDLAGYWSITVNKNWRVIFVFVGVDTDLVDYLDYHDK